MDTLVLNATYEPLKVVRWERAITLWCQGKVEILASHDRQLRAVTFTMPMPSVVRLLSFVKLRRREHVPFTRANIYARDSYTCQYCAANDLPLEDLTFDHIVPVSQGGRRDWENIVACCVSCNRSKDDRTPQQAGMKLLKPARKPAPTPLMKIGIVVRTMPKSWRDFIYWNISLDTE